MVLEGTVKFVIEFRSTFHEQLFKLTREVVLIT